MLPKPFCRLVVGGVVVVLQQIVDERIPFLLVHHALPTIHKLVSPGFGRTSDSLPNEGRAYTCRGGGGGAGYLYSPERYQFVQLLSKHVRMGCFEMLVL